MTVEARLRVHHRGCLSERTGGGTSITQMSADGDNSIFLATADTPADLDSLLPALERALTGYTLVCRSPQVALTRGGCPPSGVEECIFAYGCSIVWPALYMEGREFITIVAPSRDRVRHLLERLTEFGGAELLSVSDVRPENLTVTVTIGEIAGGLTNRQRDVLQAAVKAGYYQSPRTTSTERLAEAFGLSRATLEEHLRKAESKVIRSVMGVMGSHPLLAPARPVHAAHDGAAAPS